MSRFCYRQKRHSCLFNINQLLFVTVLVITFTPQIAQAFSASSNAASQSSTTTSSRQQQQEIDVIVVENYADIMELADLRYDEFIAREDNSGDNFISKRAFRKATAEIHQERTDEGATVFMAKTNGVAAGAAELSPVEFQGTVDAISHNPLLYVTDVVTCQHHRRMGVGNALMVAMEQEAARQCCRGHNYEYACLFLHVEPENEGALKFYSNSKLGYKIIDDNVFNMIVGVNDDGSQQFSENTQVNVDLDKLAENCVTVGQVLMIKKIAHDGSVYIEDGGLEKQVDEDSGPDGVAGEEEHTPDWLLNGLETKAIQDDGQSARITTDHYLAQEDETQYYSSPPPQKLYPRRSNRLDANSREVQIIVIITICEFLQDTGATLTETLALSEDELIVTMQHVLKYPILRQGQILCHWLKAKHSMNVATVVQEVTDEEIIDAMQNVLQIPILRQGQILSQWKVIKKQASMMF